MGTPMDRSAVAPTEDTIEALLEYLVSPLLPIRGSPDEMPDEKQQMLVAKQMHAVVILYSYYHRKQFPELEVLGFESFCKLCCIAQPGLLMYLRYMHGCEDDSENLNNLSITEKTVMDACNICIGLNSSKDTSIKDGWPVSKIAIFLVDQSKEKCVLQSSSITLGVWSIVERALEARNENCSSHNQSYESEEAPEQLAFSIVEQETGISHSNLSILERHSTYSLSHEKTTTQLYIMKYGLALGEELTEVAIEDVIWSLEGPLVKKDLTYEVTPVVEYYHILPYIEIISSWLSRENTHHNSLGMREQSIAKEGKCSFEPDGIPSIEDRAVKKEFVSNESKVHIQSSKQGKSEIINENKNDQSSMSRSSGPASRTGSPCVEPDKLSIMKNQAMDDESMQIGPDKNELNIKKNKSKHAITYNRRAGGSSRVANPCKVVDLKHPLVPDKMPRSEGHEISKRSVPNEENLNVKSNEMVKTESEIIKDLPANNMSSYAISRSQNVTDVSQVEPDSLIALEDQATQDKSVQNGQTKDVVVSNKKDVITSNQKSDDSCTKYAITSKGGSTTRDCYHRPSHSKDTSGSNIISDAYIDAGKNSINSGEDQAVMVDSDKCITKLTVDDRTCGGGAYQSECALGSLPLVPMQFSSNDDSTFYHVMASKKNDLLEASLRVFQKRRDELHQQKRLLDDEIAHCEMNIQTILREGRERQELKVESILEALNSLCPSQVQICMNMSSGDQSPSQTIKRRKLSEAVLSSEISCQELDDICLENSWVLPSYSVLPSFADDEITGMFKATVTLQGTDFECKSNGELKSSPPEARESAASHMLRTLRTWQAKEQ